MILTKEEQKKRNKEYYLKNKEQIKQRVSEYRKTHNDDRLEYLKDNSEHIKEQRKIYRFKNKEKLSEYSKQYSIEHKDELRIKKKPHVAKYQKKKYDTDPLYKFKINVRNRIAKSIRRNGYKKTSGTFKILGCSYDEFRIHMESQFECWMSWNNYGLFNNTERYGWDIDHIIPASSAVTEEELIKLNHYTNLQPLCSYHNRVVKRNTINTV